MTSSLSIFCDECGAANSRQATVCFACNELLQPPQAASPIPTSASSVQAPIQDVALLAFSPSTVGPLLPGSVLAQRYVIEGQIGQGGFGLVYKARDRKDRPVAIKQINLHALNAKEIIEATDSYNREVMLLSALEHSNLPRIYDHFTDPDHWYLVMDLIEGETLEEYLSTAGSKLKKHFFGLVKRPLPHSRRQGTAQAPYLPVKEVLDIGIELSRVLHYLHTRQPPIIFRDVKPANIMRTRKGQLYLIDFGIARLFTPGQARDTGQLGSPGYAAPEQYGKAQSTVQTDIYGLGATLQTLLTGKNPLELSITGRVGDVQLFPGRTVPKKLQQLLDQMLELDASKRPRSMIAVKRSLEHIKEGIRGLIKAYSWGLLIGSLPYPLIVLLYLFFSLHNPGLEYLLGMLSLAFYCTWPFAFLAQLITGAIFLFVPGKRVLGLGMLTMPALFILCLLERWTLPLLPGFGFGW